MNVILPKSLYYDKKLESGMARSYSSYISPQQGLGQTNASIGGTETNTGGYSSSNTIQIQIPTGRNLVMAPSESYLKFKLVVKNGATANEYIRLDKSGAQGIIQRLRLYHGTQLLEDLDNYGNIVSLFNVLQCSDSTQNKQNILNGVNNCYCTSLINELQVVPLTCGERLSNFADTAAAACAAQANTNPQTYCISLMSILGSLSEKYLPLFEMSSAPLRLELQLVSSPAQFLCSQRALTNFNMFDVEFVASFIVLSDPAIMMIKNSLMGRPLQFVVPQYRNYTYTYALANASTEVNVPVPAKFSSLKSLFMTIRDRADGALTFYPYSSNHFNLAQYRLRIGTEVLPSKPPSSFTEFFAELLKSIGSFSDINHEPLMNKQNYSQDSISIANTEPTAGVNITAMSNCFALGFDCETYGGSSKDQLFSGMNTTTSDIYWNLTHNANGSSPTVRYDVYALYDSVLVCENGIMTVKF
jgi:hypothetical protein